MNLNQLFLLLEAGEAKAIHFSLDSELRTFKLSLDINDEVERELGPESLEFSLASLRESDEVGEELAEHVNVASASLFRQIAHELRLVPIADYMISAGATSLTIRREGDSVVVVRLANEVAGHVVAYHFATTSDSLRGTDETSTAEHDRALYALSIAFRKTLFEAKQDASSLAFGIERELVLATSPILCLGGPRDGERVADSGPFYRLPTLGQVYEKRWFRSAGIERSFYVHSGMSETAASTLARAVMSGTTRSL
ncbi:hypothetical protein NA78x_002634 [Anatilimnocola sp. NA78]|uniref:hypothetical protein n=1 Tax=Anatilimnocola sp. NA78 TaxID=3415683 RepID=UPI003CE52375